MSAIKTALDALDKYEKDYQRETLAESVEAANNFRKWREIIDDAAPEALAWIKRAVPLFLDAKCGIDSAFGEQTKVADAIDALLKEARE